MANAKVVGSVEVKRFNQVQFQKSRDFRDSGVVPADPVDYGRVGYRDEHGNQCSGHLMLILIREAWERGCDFEAEADGFGEGGGTHGDWSAIRDSSDDATAKMLEKALNFLLKR